MSSAGRVWNAAEMRATRQAQLEFRVLESDWGWTCESFSGRLPLTSVARPLGRLFVRVKPWRDRDGGISAAGFPGAVGAR